ncbi:MAG: hypothetical protein U5K56_16980 [Halioglobus sp.]|nr:hypothetical protein [Halioglobus sp.]
MVLPLQHETEPEDAEQEEQQDEVKNPGLLRMSLIASSRWLFCFFLSVSVLHGCSSDSGGDGNGNADRPPDPGPTRGFQMGFTPWPFDSTITALNTTDDLIEENGDLVAHHLKQGIPWQEALTGSTYPAHSTRRLTAAYRER